MAIRYRKRIKIMPGVALNLSNKGVSTSLGAPGATINLARGKTTTTLGLPGTGVSWSKVSAKPPSTAAPTSSEGQGLATVLMAIFGGLIGLVFGLLNSKPTRKRRRR